MNIEAKSPVIEIAVDDVVFRDDLYPRRQTRADLVQQYADVLVVLPPIEINQKNELIDGWHRWTAHKKLNQKTIHAIVTETESDKQLRELAIRRNAKYGDQLKPEDKRFIAQDIYEQTPIEEQAACKEYLADLLSVDLSTVQRWLAHIDSDNRARRNITIRDLHLACWAEKAIADAVGITSQRVGQVLKVNSTYRFLSYLSQHEDIEDEDERLDACQKDNEAAALHKDDFAIPIYNVWTQIKKSEQHDHFGNSEIRWLDNLLYLYTNPYDLVIDPFAGGGSTIDLCRRRFRRYWVADRKPIPERVQSIHKHDVVVDGIPKDLPWSEVSLVYLDPPYWRQAQGKYSNDPSDLANMELDQFNEALENTITGFMDKLKSGARLSLIIQPTQWNAPNKQFTDHVADMIKALRNRKYIIDQRIQAPYSTEQYLPQMVDVAKAEKHCLVLSREIVVWRKL